MRSFYFSQTHSTGPQTLLSDSDFFIWVTGTDILAKSSVWGPVEGQQLNDSSFAIGPQPFQWEWNMKVDSVTNTAPETISKYCSRNDKLKAQIDLNGNFGGVWVNLKWKEEHQCGAEGYMRADNRFQNIRWPKRSFLRPLLFLHPLSEGRRNRLSICEVRCEVVIVCK